LTRRAESYEASPPVEQVEHLYTNLGRAYELAGEWEEARAVYEDLLSLARSTKEPRLRWSALSRLAILAVQRSLDVEAGEGLLGEALEAARKTGDRTALAETEWNLAQVATLGWEPEKALARGERALDLARELGDEELAARSLYVLASAQAFAGRWKECVVLAGEARALYAEMGGRTMSAGALAMQFLWVGSPPSDKLYVRAMEANCLCLTALGESNLGGIRVGEAAGRSALAIGREIKNDWVLVFASLNLSHNLLDAGEYEEALRLTLEGAESARSLPNPMTRFYMFWALGNAWQAVFGMEEARAAYRESLEVTGAVPAAAHGIIILSGLCANRAMAGDWEAARAWAVRAIKTRRETPSMLVWRDLQRHHEVEALLRGGDGGLAREEVARFGERLGGNRRYRIPYLRAKALLSRWDGETGRAVEHLLEAEALAEKLGLPGEAWQIQVALGGLHEERGEPREARAAFRHVAAVLRKLGGRIEDEGLRTRFLSTPRVRRVLDTASDASERVKP
jgi:tetratricopeptide (TPR) repeat protein